MGIASWAELSLTVGPRAVTIESLGTKTEY